MGEGSWVGLDVHARSVLASVLDAGSGELRTQRVPAESEQTVAWLSSLPRPVRVAPTRRPRALAAFSAAPSPTTDGTASRSMRS